MLGAGAGLAASIAVESGPELGEALNPVKARGYWEQVWLRFKRDRVAIAGGIFIIFLSLVAFVGAPIAAAVLGHGPNQIFAEGLDDETLLPVGPGRREQAPYIGAAGNYGDTLFILGGDSQLGRDLFLRLLYGAQTSLEVALLATFFSVSIGVIMGLMAGYYRGAVDTRRLAPDGDRDGVPGAALHHRHRGHGRGPARQDHLRGLLPRRLHPRPDLHDLRLVLSGADHPRRRCCRCARRSSSRPRA